MPDSPQSRRALAKEPAYLGVGVYARFDKRGDAIWLTVGQQAAICLEPSTYEALVLFAAAGGWRVTV